MRQPDPDKPVFAFATRVSNLNILALVTEAHGGFGGISQYNRDALEALASFDTVSRVHVLPRLSATHVGELSAKINYHFDVAGSMLQYVLGAVRLTRRIGKPDLIFCGHINLMPVAMLLKQLCGSPVVLTVYGIDAWHRPRRCPPVVVTRGASAILSISAITRSRMLTWCPFPEQKTYIVPNAIRLADYGLRAKRGDLVARFGLAGKTTLMTMGRMATEERYKGFDEVIRALPRLVGAMPGLAYLVVGDGTDRPRLEALASQMNIRDKVIFTGRIDDRDKADYFSLADAYVMPSTGEGFGFVILEALASGVPVVASSRDGTREALRDGQLGVLVDPQDEGALIEGIKAALARPKNVPEGLQYFSFDNFAQRLRLALASACRI